MSGYAYLKNHRPGCEQAQTVPLPTVRQTRRARLRAVNKMLGTIRAQKLLLKLEGRA